MASIGWIDFSHADAEKVGTILDLLKPEGMVDELGIGTIRDALADQLFPGISTIQTRAKYFFIIPYILYEYQALKAPQKKAKSAIKFLDEREHEIMWYLAEKYNHEDGHGVIGVTKRRPNRIMRRPSEIYWNGLYTYHLIDTGRVGVNSFLRMRSVGGIESLISNPRQNDDDTGDDADADYENIFRIKISPNVDWFENFDLELTEEEADILRSRIVDLSKGKLIGELLSDKKLYTQFTQVSDFMDFAKLAYGMPEINGQVRKMLVLSHDVSELVFGAHIAYNILLQKQKYNKECFYDEWNSWLSNLKQTMLDYDNLQPNVLFTHPYAVTAKEFTRNFVIHFWDFVNKGDKSIDPIEELIIQQEYRNKGNKARLKWNRWEDVKEGEWIGLRRLDYRYRNAKVILNDIQNGLKS
jgi:Family of unknown function (DUF6361)